MPISQAVIKLAAPMIFSSLAVIIYNMADTFSVLYTIFRQSIMAVLGVQSDMKAATADYLFWVVTLGALPSILHVVIMQIVRSEGSSVVASMGIAIGCPFKVIVVSDNHSNSLPLLRHQSGK